MRYPKGIRIDSAETSTSSAPTAATDGVAVPKQLLSRGFPYTRIDTEVVTNGGTTPTLTTAVMFGDDGRMRFLLQKAAASGTRTCRVKVHGYVAELMDLTENAGASVDDLDDVASSAAWHEIFDSGALSEAADYNYGYVLEAGDIAVTTGDIDVELGAVEIKNATDDTRAKVVAAASAADTDNALVVADPNLDAKVPALGTAVMAAATPVTLATDDTQYGAVGAAADVDGNVHGQLRYIGEAVDSIPEVGAAAMAASLPVTLATDDTHMGAVGAASDTDGVIHGQLRYGNDQLDTIGGDTTSLDAKDVEIDFSAAPTQVSLSTTTARSAQLAVGRYIMKSDARVFVRQGNVTSDATVTTDFALEAGVAYQLYVSNTTTLGYVSGILAAGTGTLDIQAVL